MKPAMAILLSLSLVACAGKRAYDEGLSLIDQGRVEEGLSKISDASRLEPDNRQYRSALFRERDAALQRQLALAETARQQGQFDVAETLYKQMLQLDPLNSRAKAGIDAARTERRHRGMLVEAEALFKKGDEATAQARARSVLAENSNSKEAQQLVRRIEERALRAASAGPRLSAALKKPVTLEFRDASVRQVFELLSRSTGLNFIFDREVRADLRTTVFVKDSSVEDVLRFVLVTNQLERKVLSENTVLIYPNTPAKLRDYQDLVVKTFYLANIDAKSASNMIKTMVKTKDLHIDEKLNLVVMRDTPDAVRLAEKLIANQDLAEAEVMLEVEVMEVGSNSLYNVGLQYPDQVSWSLMGAGGAAGTVTLPEWLNRNAGLVRLSFTNPFFAINFRNTLGRTNLLANPRIRVKNKEKAKVHIGDKVPVITTTSTATGFVSESVTYLDVGLKLDVEPAVFLEDEVGIKIGLEVSNIVREIRSQSGTLTYQVGTRNAATTLRLKDGETQVLAGLISDEDRKSAAQIPGLGSLPLVERLFGSHQDTFNKTEVVLLITPRVVRNIARPEFRLEEFPGGTEAAVGAAPLLLQSAVVPALSAPLSLAAPSALGTPTSAAASASSDALAVAKVSLVAPSGIPTTGEFKVQVAIDTSVALRGGLLDLAFDASTLKFLGAEAGAHLVSSDKDAALRVNAHEGLGRLNLSFGTRSDIKGAGEIATLTFSVVGSRARAPLRMEAISFTGAAGQIVKAPVPPPLSLDPR